MVTSEGAGSFGSPFSTPPSLTQALLQNLLHGEQWGWIRAHSKDSNSYDPLPLIPQLFAAAHPHLMYIPLYPLPAIHWYRYYSWTSGLSPIPFRTHRSCSIISFSSAIISPATEQPACFILNGCLARPRHCLHLKCLSCLQRLGWEWEAPVLEQAASGGHSWRLEISGDIELSSARWSTNWLLLAGQQKIKSQRTAILSLSVLEAALKPPGILFKAQSQSTENIHQRISRVQIKGERLLQ